MKKSTLLWNISLITMGPTTDWCPSSQLRPAAPLTWGMSSKLCQHTLSSLCLITFLKYSTISLSWDKSLFSLNSWYPGHTITWRWVSLEPITSPGSEHPGHVHRSRACCLSLWKFILIVGVMPQSILKRRRASVMLRLDKYGFTLNDSFSISS